MDAAEIHPPHQLRCFPAWPSMRKLRERRRDDDRTGKRAWGAERWSTWGMAAQMEGEEETRGSWLGRRKGGGQRRGAEGAAKNEPRNSQRRRRRWEDVRDPAKRQRRGGGEGAGAGRREGQGRERGACGCGG